MKRREVLLITSSCQASYRLIRGSLEPMSISKSHNFDSEWSVVSTFYETEEKSHQSKFVRHKNTSFFSAMLISRENFSTPREILVEEVVNNDACTLVSLYQPAQRQKVNEKMYCLLEPTKLETAKMSKNRNILQSFSWRKKTTVLSTSKNYSISLS